MKLLLVLCSALIIHAAHIKDEKICDGVIINGVYHDLEVLKKDVDRPFLLAVDYGTNNLFFSYSLSLSDDAFKSVCINLNTKQLLDIANVTNGFAHTVDRATHDVYIGTNNGIYKYDQKNKTADLLKVKNADIWTIYFKDGLYYVDFPGHFLYKVVDGKSVRYKDLEDTKIDNFVIDDDNEIFYTNATGLYGQKMGSKDAVLYQEFFVQSVRGIATDTEGKVYVCVNDGIYRVDKTTTSLVKVVDIDDGFGVAFDNQNNLIYSDATSLNRLIPNKDKTC